ncbi:MAG: hypothetical protein GX755_01945, partial [Syntrophomonadaceae bacterium]|nr:hypothetical protein [Syntrophomonadaceae bacterium]
VDWRDIARVNEIGPPYFLTIGRRLAIPGISCEITASGSLTDSFSDWSLPAAAGDNRALILATTENAPDAMPYVLLDNAGNIVLVNLDRAPDPASFGWEYNTYKVWLISRGRYTGYAMHRTPHQVWTYRGPKPLSDFEAIVISVEGETDTDMPTGPIIATGRL